MIVNRGHYKFAPTTIDDFAYAGSNKFSMLVDHDKKDLCDTYIVEFAHDPTDFFMRRELMLIDISIISSSLSLC